MQPIVSRAGHYDCDVTNAMVTLHV
jgi:hypothetical protein